ncbi:energy transducer TonB [Jhaorihella thermophila]|uniref:Cell division and transport-associated protein TolA n=1 Tax=Jhaorihella thermophila TaxID=488547 RepID=A0A1H5U932_9RHOB|nr:energy transducer TonB [Jhaorihella thermophila]SEF70851.1 hypothetical protein SAMN05421751_103251 [Jhaorihella thermophila]
MQTGTKISGIAHLLLIGWAVFGGSFDTEPLPFEVHDVSVISAEEFAAMTARPATPDVAAEPEAPAPPEAPVESPDLAAATEAVPAQDAPDLSTPPEIEAAPEPAPEIPVPDVAPDDTPPVPVQPEQDVAVLTPLPVPSRPESRAVDRVAPQPVAPPPPEARPDEVTSPAVTPDEGGETRQAPKEQTAPEAATDRIITEADKGDEVAPSASLRPRARPARVARREPKPAEKAPDAQSAVKAALAEALGGGAASPDPAPSGPPLTAGEKDALRVAVSNCWNVGSLSTEALRTTVVVSVRMNRDGRPDAGSIRMLSSTGGSQAAAQQAFGAARRAIIRCGANGYKLPPDKYDRWRDIEMTFNPERMRIK